MNGERAVRPLVCGEVLYDVFPDGEAVLGGAPFNVAWNLQALGLAPLFVSRVGDDEPGRRIAKAMADWGLDPAGLQTDPEHPTGQVTVRIVDGEPDYDIEFGRAYDLLDAGRLPDTAGTGLLYHGSLILRAPAARAALAALRKRAAVPVFVDVNLRDPWWDADTVRSCLDDARWAKLNAAELAALAPGGASDDQRADSLLAATSLEALIVTLGADGARCHERDGGRHQVRPPADVPVVDTVGAGDAFSSVVILGLVRGWSWPDILARAQGFAAAVVGLRGAITDDRGFYAPYGDNVESS